MRSARVRARTSTKRVREKRMKRVCGKSALGKAVESGKTEKIFLKNTKNRRKGEKTAKNRKNFKKISEILHKRLTSACTFGNIDTLRKYAVYWADAGSYCKSEEKATSADNFRRQCEGSTLATDRGFA